MISTQDHIKPFRLKAIDGLWLSCVLFEQPHPKGVIQIIHGAKGYKRRYYPFAQFLWEHGFAVVISDSRGHGESVSTDWPLGHMEGVQVMVSDQYRVSAFARKRYPGVPLMLFGHSLGSCIARAMLQRHDDWYAKLVLTGTVTYVPISGFGAFLIRFLGAVSKLFGNDLLLTAVVNRSSLSWVCNNEKSLADYQNDHFVRDNQYDTGALWTICEANYELKRYRKYQLKNPGLPIFSATGKEDPVPGGKRGLMDTVYTLRKIGYRHVKCKTYRGMKHEVLNEKDHMRVYRDIVSFFEG